MVYSIYGTVTAKTPATLILRSGGVEWELTMSLRSLSRYNPSPEEVRVFTFLHHWQDGMRLYGFGDVAEKDLFHELIKVDGIGPRQAIRILSGMSPREFSVSVTEADVKRLCAIPGLGQKTAQKIILALQGVLAAKTDDSSHPAANSDDLVLGLVEMGFDQKKAARAIAAARESATGEEEILRLAIVSLSKGG